MPLSIGRGCDSWNEKCQKKDKERNIKKTSSLSYLIVAYGKYLLVRWESETSSRGH